MTHAVAGFQGASSRVTVEIDRLEDGHGLRVRDTAEGEQFPLRTDRPVDPTPAATDDFAMPVDAAVAVEAAELHLPVFTDAIFWQDGEAVHHVESDAGAQQFGPGSYEIALSQPGAKLSVGVEDAVVSTRFADEHTYLVTGSATRLVVGVRSYHETPAGTVTVRDDPRDAMAAVSTFGSALKTLSPDRSWPTLRGHPPAIERGNSLAVPDAVEAPETGVTVEVPPEYPSVYTVAPLAYYLGATVEPGDEPRLVAAGREVTFDSSGLPGDVRDVLEHVFALDCVIRAAGIYPFRSRAADRLDERVDLDYESLFELPLAERTAAYLEVPRSATEGLLEWHYTADVAPDATYAPALPYLVDELALVRSPPARQNSATLTPSPDALDAADGAIARSARDASGSQCSVVVPGDVDTPGHCWVGDGFAARAANPTVGSFRRGFEWPADAGPLDVHVVYNDARLAGVEPDAYDVHPYRETAVSTSRNHTTNELRAELNEDVDFLHFVGHVTEAGMVCRDGVLDVRTLARTGVSAFFLNGCRSYEQGRALLTAGSVGGIVTVDDVADATASSVGRKAAMLLDAGFPLYAVLEILELTGTPSGRYSILGPGTFALRRADSGIPIVHELDSETFDAATDRLPVTIRRYPNGEDGLGGLTSYNQTATDSDVQSARVTETSLSRANLEGYLSNTSSFVILDGDLRLVDDLSVSDFR